MTSLAMTCTDSVTMLRRNLRHMVRYPGLTGFVVGIPVVLLLVFVYVFGGTLGAGLPGGSHGGAVQDYLAYVLPGILLIAVAGVASGASIGMAMDMTEGIVARFRSMAISRAAVLTGHVLGNAIQGVLVSVLLVGVAVLMGFRPAAGPLGWLAVAGIIALVSLAVSWIGVALGVSAGSVASASNSPMILTLLVFLGSGFVPVISMPGGGGFRLVPAVHHVHRDGTGVHVGRDPGANLWLALGWGVLLILIGYVWARALYIRKSVR